MKKFAYPITFPDKPSTDTTVWRVKSLVKTAEDIANGGSGTESTTDYPVDAVDPITDKFPEGAKVEMSVAAGDDATPVNFSAYSASSTFDVSDTVPPPVPGGLSFGTPIQFDE